MIIWVKYFINKIFSSRYKRVGLCKQCGECCRSIVLSENGEPVNTVEMFEILRKKYKKYNHFEPYQFDDVGNLLFKCKSLRKDNKCSDYFFRSFYCRKYPAVDKKFIMLGGKMLDNCGYNFEPTKKFSDYLD